ncbi:hypothetical protein [Aeromonas sp. Y311-2]|jgi:hypothetical protein|uniref:hypothetical protein n=1 Tax=Aeromonas sp. Y311-2 TaxID=2990507 RepID=UPI0022E93FD0|nr:hypothetical protein [Aeromonas sp. Y311-2]
MESQDDVEIVWNAEQYLSSVPADIDTVAESGGLMAWAEAECAFSESIIEGGASALAAVAADQIRVQLHQLAEASPNCQQLRIGKKIIHEAEKLWATSKE